MMLSNGDFKKIEKILDVKLKPIKNDVGSLKTDVKDLKTDVKVLKTDVNLLKGDVTILKTGVLTMKKDIAKIRNDQKTIVNYFDREYLDLGKHVTQIEDYLKLPAVN